MSADRNEPLQSPDQSPDRGAAPGETGRVAANPYPESGVRIPPPPGRMRPGGLTEDGRLRNGRLAGKTMNGAILILSWPILIESLLSSLVGFVDTRLASGLGVGETDAIGAASYITWFFGLTVMALGIGATAVISRAVGRGRLAVANAAVGQTILLQIATGILVAACVIALAPSVASVMNLTGDARRAFVSYLSIVATGIPLMGVLYGSIACVRGAGDSIRPLLVMIVVNIVNITASFALSGVDIAATRFEDGEPVTKILIANPFPTELGVVGIALGTIIAHFVGMVLMIGVLINGVGGVRLIGRRLKLHTHTARRLVRLGLPNFIETLGLWLGNFAVVLMVGSMGAGALGTHIIAIRAEAFSFLPGFAMGAAAATLVGQYLGAGSVAMARAAVWRCALIACGLMGAFGAAFILFPVAIVSIFSEQPEHLASAPKLLVICGVVQIPFALSIVFRQAMRGAGDVRMAMMLTWATTYGVRLPLAFVFSGADLAFTRTVDGEFVRTVILVNPFRDEPTLTGLWYALCAELVVRGAVYTARFLQGGWAHKKV
ncbi:MAG: MATE family efflux transporter [Phycisphaerales bacterium]|nr:MAG: MATE family efflux transporter [Phycisphaerales bacterium]